MSHASEPAGTVTSRSPKWLTRPVISWLLYDAASSAYILMVPAVAFALYFRSYVAEDRPGADALWSLVVALPLLASGLLAPVLGSLADQSSRRRALLAVTTIMCCISTALLFTIGRGEIFYAGLLFFFAHVGYMLATSLYNSYLAVIAPRERAARLSGLGWGLGFLGGITCFLICLPLIRGGLDESNVARFATAFLVTATFFFALALPALRALPSGAPRALATIPTAAEIAAAYLRVSNTVRQWRRHRELAKFMLAFYLINDAVVTVVYFTAIFLSSNFGLDVVQILWLSVLFQLLAAPSTALFGHLAERWSLKPTIFVTLAIWVVVVLVMAFGTAGYVPVLIAVLLSLVLGSTQSLCRAQFAVMIPPDRSSELFGFHALAGRASAILGPLTFGTVSAISGSQRVAVLSLLLFIGAGAVVLARVRVEQGSQQ